MAAKKKKPDVSIIIPTLNEEKLIGMALESIKNQEFDGSYEVILGDGSSTDKTREIAKKYTDKIAVEPPTTISRGRKIAGEKAEGEIIISAGADVKYPKNWLKEMVKPFEDPEVVAVTGKPFPLDGTKIDELFSDYLMHPLAIFLNFVGWDFVYGDCVAMRKTAYDKIGGFDDELITGEDMDVVRRIKKYGKVIYNPKAVAHFSTRRIRKWGAAKYFLFHLKNFFDFHLFHKHAMKYEPVR